MFHCSRALAYHVVPFLGAYNNHKLVGTRNNPWPAQTGNEHGLWSAKLDELHYLFTRNNLKLRRRHSLSVMTHEPSRPRTKLPYMCTSELWHVTVKRCHSCCCKTCYTSQIYGVGVASHPKQSEIEKATRHVTPEPCLPGTKLKHMPTRVT